MNDCDLASDYSGTGDSANPLTGIAFTSDGDFFTLTGTCDSVNDEWAYRQHDLTAAGLTFSTSTYPNYLVRWRTEVSSNGLGAVVKVEDSLAALHNLVGSATIPLYDQEWTVTSGSLATGLTITDIYLYANDYPDTIAAGSFSVYYDFILFYKDLFTFPHVSPGGITVDFPDRFIDIPIPRRGSPVTQYIGAREAISIKLKGDMKAGETWGSLTGASADNTPGTFGEYILKIYNESVTYPWQWFTSDMINCKVTMRKPTFVMATGSKAQRTYELELKYYSLSDITGEDNLQWLGFEQ